MLHIVVCSNVNNLPPGLILGLRLANERRRYKVTPSLIGWEQTQNQPCGSCDDVARNQDIWGPCQYKNVVLPV